VLDSPDIKHLILDIDGIIVGEKVGYNAPSPHPDVLRALQEVRAGGISVSLCTAKPHYSIRDIIEGASLDNPHITDAGAVIIDPIDDVVVEQHVLPKDLAGAVMKLCLDNRVYVEFYTVDDYFIQQDQVSYITPKHTQVLQRNPVVVDSLLTSAAQQAVTKVMPIAEDERDKERIRTLLEAFRGRVSLGWGVHPVALPLQYGIVTAPGSSKQAGAAAVLQSLNGSFENTLGVGDSTSDWGFIERCGYAATLKNGTEELKELVRSKGEGKSYIGPSVDENGILDILSHFPVL